jgi:hypothetical protein
MICRNAFDPFRLGISGGRSAGEAFAPWRAVAGIRRAVVARIATD